jgi:hypothetical protein
LLAGAALIVLTTAVKAQSPDPRSAGATIQGKFRGIQQELLLLQPVHAAHRQTVTQKMRGLLDIVLRNPALSPPIGLDFTAGLLARTPLVGVNRSVVQYEMSLGLLWYTILSGGKIIPEYVSARGFHLHANNISLVWDTNESWVEDRTKQTFWEPRQVSQEAGHPYYHTHAMVMKKSERPIWIPLTQAQVLAQRMRRKRWRSCRRKQNAECMTWRATMSPAWRRRSRASPPASARNQPT